MTGSDPGTCTAWSAATDPVLAALANARSRRDQAREDIRILLAYARELTRPRPCQSGLATPDDDGVVVLAHAPAKSR